MKPLNQIVFRQFLRRLKGWACALALVTATGTAFASPPINTSDPLGFFTNVASSLLSSQLNVNLTHIQVYPTNQYTPAVHRLLQVTANIYDATTTNYYPSVFRPIFWVTNEYSSVYGQYFTNVYINGYQYVYQPLNAGNNENLNGPIFVAPVDPTDPGILGLAANGGGISMSNIWGVPWVLGVKKGLPNFNALELDNCFFIERKLQFNRNSSAPSSGMFPYGRTYTTNQMYVMGISNLFAVEDWNSYASNYNNSVTIMAQDALSVGFANDAAGFTSIANTTSTFNFTNVNPWSGRSFILPLGTNVVMQNLGSSFSPPSTNNLYTYYYGPNSTNIDGFNFAPPCFIPQFLDSYNFLDAGTPPLPHFGLQITNRLWAYILDTDTNGNVHLLDYVQLGSMNNSLDINSAIADPDNSGLWSTNFYQGVGTLPYGVVQQFFVSSIGGAVPTVDRDGGVWSTSPIPGTTDTSPAAQQAFFSAFFSAGDAAFYGAGTISNLQLSIPASFTPERLIVQRMVYQANDPLVHYLTSDLNDFADDTSNIVSLTTLPPGIEYIGHISDRYMPWGVAGNLSKVVYDNIPPDSNPYNLAYKDPSVASADSWVFPTNESLNASWLGQVHRGTPWQTIYLKSSNILDLNLTIPQGESFNDGLPTWQLWTGDLNPTDAANMAPVQDWRMASLLASLFNTNTSNYASLFSVNDGNSGDWENVLNGMMVLSNDFPDVVVNFRPYPGFTTFLISSNSSQAATIASAIESTRAGLPLQLLMDKGDIFSVPQLSDDSPYLNVDSAQVDHGISDQAYEAIPSQLLPLLRTDSIGSVTNNGQFVIQFTGDDGHVYAVQTSCDLAHWTSVATNCPANGIFTYTNTVTAKKQFYRTVLVQ